MKVLHIGIAGVALVSLVGCSSIGLGSKRIDYRSGAENVPALEIPPDLTAPSRDERYMVPGADEEVFATYSDYSKGGSVSAPRVSAGVLPEMRNVHMERNGTQRWLVVNDRAEKVWPEVKAFWQGIGLTIASEDQAAGLMETNWAENRANIQQGPVRSAIGKVFDNIYSSGERDQYRIRLERGKDGGSTEIYVTHRGMEEVLAADGNTSKWQPRAADPEMEAEVLQRLMVHLGGNKVQAAQEIAAGDAAHGATPAAPAGDGKAELLEIFDGSSIVVINDAFDRSWRRVGLAIERAGLAVEDKDRIRGIYFLRPVKAESGWMDKLQFWKDSNSELRYRVNVKDGGVSCEVSVTDQDGTHDDATKRMIEAIYKNIDR